MKDKIRKLCISVYMKPLKLSHGNTICGNCGRMFSANVRILEPMIVEMHLISHIPERFWKYFHSETE